MNLIQLSSSVIFIMILTGSIPTEQLNNSRTSNNILLPYVIPLHYVIQLTHQYIESNDLFLEFILSIGQDGYSQFGFKGETGTTINILQSTQYIKLHLLHLIIVREKVTLTTTKGIIYVLDKHEYSYQSNMIVFPLFNILLPGLYTLKIEYFGNLKGYEENSVGYYPTLEKIIYKYFYKRNDVALLIAPFIQANGIRQLFPCWDEPHLKTTFNISIKHHGSLTALSNMPTRFRIYTNHDNLFRTNFHITPSMSTFQVALVLTNYHHIEINKNISLWCESCSELQWSLKFEFAKRIIENITLHLKSEFSEINIPKMDHIAVSNFPQDGTSKWGLIFHTEANLLCDEQLDSVIRKIEVARLIAPRIAYQWFSNIYSSWWSYFEHLWLHDGLAILLGEETIVKIFNNSKVMDFFIVQNQYESLHLDSHFYMNPTQIISRTEMDPIFSFPRYLKVLIVLRMFQSAITDKEFRNKVHTYVNRHTFSSIISNDFWSTQEDMIAYECHIPSHKFLTWIQYRHYPTVSLKEKTRFGGRLSQNYNSTIYGNWLILLNLKNFREPFLPQNITKCLTPDSVFLDMYYYNYTNWTYNFIVNIHQAGYYRVKYESEGWHAIANYLNSTAGEYENISVINRAKILDDAFHLMIERQLNVSVFWNLTQYLSQETNYAAWYPMFKVFEYMSTIFPFSEDDIKVINVKEKFRELLDKTMRTLGYDGHLMENDITKCLRQEIVKWACMLQNHECSKAALRKLQQHLKNPKIYPLLPGWKQWTYCNGLATANSSTWSQLKDIWLERPNHKLLPFLTCSFYGSHQILSSSFKELFTQDKRQDIVIIRAYINVFQSIIMKHANTDYMLDRIFNYLENVKFKRINTLTVILVGIINHVYFSRNLRKISDYLEKARYNITGLQLLRFKNKIKTREAEINNHIDHFQFINVP